MFYINLENLESIGSEMEFENGQIGVGTVTASSLVVRGAASQRGEDLKHRAYLSDDVKVTEKHIDETGKLWYKIESLTAEPFSGWVSGKYISFKIVLD